MTFDNRDTNPDGARAAVDAAADVIAGAVAGAGVRVRPNLAPLRQSGRVYQVRRASELMGTYGTVIIIYGPPGAGKSTLAAQAADSEHGSPVMVIDVEGGARAYGHRDDIDVVPIVDYDERHTNGMGFEVVEQVLGDLIAGKMQYGTVILDNVSELNAYCTYDTLRTVARNIDRKDRPDQKDWNTTTSRMLLLIRRFRDFAQSSGTNVIIIAWDRSQEDRVTAVTKKDLAMNPALSGQLPGLVDVVGYLTITKKGVRTLTFDASPVTAAKFRRSANEIANTIPGTFVYDFDSPHKPMVDLLDCLKGGKPFPANRYRLSGSGTADRGTASTAVPATDVQGQIRG